jgi:hypothetical protein
MDAAATSIQPPKTRFHRNNRPFGGPGSTITRKETTRPEAICSPLVARTSFSGHLVAAEHPPPSRRPSDSGNGSTSQDLFLDAWRLC